MNEQLKQLSAAILLQSAKDYVKEKNNANRKAIIRELRSDWMTAISDGQSLVVADQLINHGGTIKKRIIQAYATA